MIEWMKRLSGHAALRREARAKAWKVERKNLMDTNRRYAKRLSECNDMMSKHSDTLDGVRAADAPGGGVPPSAEPGFTPRIPPPWRDTHCRVLFGVLTVLMLASGVLAAL